MGLKGNVKAITRNIKKIKNNAFFRAKFLFTKYYDEGSINENEVLIQCYGGSGISCNPYYFLEELCENKEFSHLKLYVVATAREKGNMQAYMTFKGYNQVTVLELHSKEYCKTLAQAKYLINNVSFPTYFIKKEGQVYLNTWHGTPLKALGKAMTEEMHTIGNVQRNFMMCDYIIAPNKFTFDVLRNDYMLNNFYQGSYLLCGYPRNHIFYDVDKQNKIRAELGLEGKKIIVYMPTWRGSHAVRRDKDQFVYIMHMLVELDKHVDEDTVVFMKEHNMSTFKVDFKDFANVRAFPDNMETYEFLSIADVLITDYSSVMFDFANTGRKVVLYAYDKEEYLRERGMYMEFDKLPFSIVTTTKELIAEVQNLEYGLTYNKQIQDLIEYDKVNTINDILHLMMGLEVKSKELNVIDGKSYGNGKENVLIFTGALLRNGITTALKGILNNVNKEERNYILTFTQNAVAPNKVVLRELGDFEYLPVMGQKNFRFVEAVAYFLYYRFNVTNKFVEQKLERIYKREIKRIYPGMKFNYAIHYTGYERHYMNLFRFMDTHKITYVHNNLIEEHKNRGNVHLPTVEACYGQYDKIVIIRDSLEQELLGSVKDIKERVHVAHNLNNYEDIQAKAQLPIAFDDNTESTHSVEEIEKILDTPENTVFINIARFSVEKALDNLVSAFENYYNAGNENSYLIIIGGHGNKYKALLEQVAASNAKDNIVIIKWISNPHAILNKSDVFVLSSHYEGLPMVIMEALILGKPVISTSIPGPREFLEQGYGYLVEDSVEGLVQGMNEYKANKLAGLKPFDYVAFNEKALEEFDGLFKSK